MTTIEAITEQAARLPEVLQLKLLNYAMYLEHRPTDSKQAKSSRSPEERRAALAKALEDTVRVNPFAEIQDPVAWQREQRSDRLLPNREEPC